MAKARMAKEALKWLFSNQGQRMGSGEIAFRVLPDVGFGALEAVMTPGDIGDKLIAGTGSALGGVSGGLLLGKLGGSNQMLANALDLAGSVGGDFAGRAGADMLLRGKDKLMGGKGQNPYERLNEEQQQLLAESVRAQVLSELGLLPGSTQQYFADATTGMGVN